LQKGKIIPHLGNSLASQVKRKKKILKPNFKNLKPLENQRRKNKMTKSVYEIITEKIIEKLKKGVVPWRQPWTNSNAVDALFDTISNALAKEEKIQLIGFGTFEVRERAARTGSNPQTGEEIQISASKVPAFKLGRELKEAVK
jgi:DNA-binding protein HU-beta